MFINKSTQKITYPPSDHLVAPLNLGFRRKDFDVSDTVNVTNVNSVNAAVRAIFESCYPAEAYKNASVAFNDFSMIYAGNHPDYHGCDTPYHDMQHVLDVTLAVMRLIDGYEKSHDKSEQFGAELAVTAIISALFHDVGYIRHISDDSHTDGAEFTQIHVSRSGKFLADYFNRLGMSREAKLAPKLVEFTGYERPVESLLFSDNKLQELGYILGTGDVIAQMADRMYLEQCRDCLYPEFVRAGLAKNHQEELKKGALYQSPEDLLARTPQFIRSTIKQRLNKTFHSVYKYAETHFGGPNLYLIAVTKNLEYIETQLHNSHSTFLRRQK